MHDNCFAQNNNERVYTDQQEQSLIMIMTDSRRYEDEIDEDDTD